MINDVKTCISSCENDLSQSVYVGLYYMSDQSIISFHMFNGLLKDH